MIKLVFCGTPEFAIPSFKALLADNRFEILGVMTQPDRPSGRGQKLTQPPVKVLALENNLVVKQPERLRKEPDMIQWLRDLKPDFLVTAAFGQILSQEVLDIPKYGTVNVHASLLPQYRGPNPIQWAILNGDKTAGITTMLTELGVDTGAMLLKAETPIDINEDAVSLVVRMAELGADILPKTLVDYAAGKLIATPQDESKATHAPKLAKHDANIDWSLPAEVIHNKVRGQQPWPGAVTQIDGKPLKVLKTKLVGIETDNPSPTPLPEGEGNNKEFSKSLPFGSITATISSGLVVSTGTGPIIVEMVQPAGKPKTLAKDWANGALPHITNHRFEPVTE